MESRTNLIDELSVELGDLAYRQSSNWKAKHNIKFLDVMVQLKRFLVDWKPKGKIKTRLRYVNILYPYFANTQMLNPYSTASKFQFQNKEWFVKTMKKHIGEWLDDMKETNAEYRHRDLMRTKYFEILDEWDRRKWNIDATGQSPYELTMLFSNMKQWILVGDILTNDHMKITKHFTTMVPSKQPGNNTGYAKTNYEAQHYQEEHHNLYAYLWNRFNRHIATKPNHLYNLPVKLDEGKRMNYSTTPRDAYSILNWKKTMKNGNCSNKDLKAIHHYYYLDGYGNEKGKGRWEFGGITASLAIRIADINGKPKTDKKATYEDIKMWWYKLEA